MYMPQNIHILCILYLIGGYYYSNKGNKNRGAVHNDTGRLFKGFIVRNSELGFKRVLNARRLIN